MIFGRNIKDIAAPTLVVHAGSDVITGPRTTLPLEQGLPNVIGVTMPDVAHVVAGKQEKNRLQRNLARFS